MASESGRCVDELLVKLSEIDDLSARFDCEHEKASQADKARLVQDCRQLLSTVQLFVDNNKALIPAYILKTTSSSLKRLETRVNESGKSKLQFKFTAKPSSSMKCAETKQTELAEERERGTFTTREFQSDFFGFQNETDKKLKLEREEVESKDIKLVNLKGCTIRIFGSANTIYIRDLDNCSVIVCLACRAITVTSSSDCSFKFICQQLRIDSTMRSEFHLFTSARAMLEASSGLKFSRLDLNNVEDLPVEKIRELMKEAHFNELENNWQCIDDFDWLSPSCPSKNFSICNE